LLSAFCGSHSNFIEILYQIGLLQAIDIPLSDFGGLGPEGKGVLTISGDPVSFPRYGKTEEIDKLPGLSPWFIDLVLRSVETYDKHVGSAVVDAKLVCLRPACKIDVIVTVNSRNSAAGTSSGAVLTEFLDPYQLAFG
jgi:hypothetical protein